MPLALKVVAIFFMVFSGAFFAVAYVLGFLQMKADSREMRKETISKIVETHSVTDIRAALKGRNLNLRGMAIIFVIPVGVLGAIMVFVPEMRSPASVMLGLWTLAMAASRLVVLRMRREMLREAASQREAKNGNDATRHTT